MAPVNEVRGRIAAREEFADECKRRGVKTCIEVGVDHGVYSAAFLRRYLPDRYYAIDPYPSHGLYPFDRRPDIIMASIALQPFGDAPRLIIAPSVDIAHSHGSYWKPGFVYLDGDHSLKGIREDLEAWWPCIPAGGLLAGHDYWAGPSMEAHGVVQAVREFAAKHGLQITLTHDPVKSWWFEKPR